MKKLICALLACMLILITGCGSKKAEETRWPVEVNGVSFESAVKKAVSLSPTVTESMYMMGYGGRLVGMSEFCAAPKSAKKPVRVGNSLLVDTESIVKLSPDVVFTSVQLPKNAVEALNAAEIKIVVIPPAESSEQILDNCRLIATAFEGSEKAQLIYEQLELFFETTLDYIAECLENEIDPGETTAVYLRKTPLVLATGDSLENELLQRIGFVNPAAEFEDWSYPSEETDSLSPDIIFRDKSVQKKAMLKSEFYANSPAVAEEKVFSLDAKVFERRSPRLFFELEETMREAFPEAFEIQKPSFVMDIEPPPEPEKSWWEKLFD